MAKMKPVRKPVKKSVMKSVKKSVKKSVMKPMIMVEIIAAMKPQRNLCQLKKSVSFMKTELLLMILPMSNFLQKILSNYLKMRKTMKRLLMMLMKMIIARMT